MRRLCFSDRQLLLAFTTYIRPFLEYCCPVWGPQTQNTAYMVDELENVQKRATRIKLGPNFSSYESALELLNFLTLFDRRQRLIMKFEKSLLTNEKHRSILPSSTSINRHTRNYNKLEPVKCCIRKDSQALLYHISQVHLTSELKVVPYFVSLANK